MSYTPTNWQTGDTITAEKLNNMESGIAAAPQIPINPSGKNGAVLRLAVPDTGSAYWSVGDEIFDFSIDYDGESFSVSLTSEQKTELNDALYNGINVIGFVTGFPFGFVFRPATYALLGGYDILQTGVVPLDDIGLAGYVGYLVMSKDTEGLWNVTLIKWEAS